MSVCVCVCCQIDVNPSRAGQSRAEPPPLPESHTASWLKPLKQLKVGGGGPEGASADPDPDTHGWGV